MEKVKELIERVNNTSLELRQRYPELWDTGKKNIVFVSPMLNKHGLYRMILPALELMETKRYSCIVTNILPENPAKIIDDFNVKLIPEIIRWADYIVFQANGQDMTPLISEIKTINPKVKIVLDVERIYHNLNPNNYAAKKFTIEKQRNLENNIRMVDISTYPDKATEDFYQKKIGLNIKTAILPNLLSPFQFEGWDKNVPRPADKEGKVRVLLMADQDDFDDINSFRESIAQITVKVPQAKIFVLTNSIMYDSKNPLRLVNFTKVPYKDMTEYYKIIWNMNPDIGIIPLKKQDFSRNYYKILEFGAFGIPMVSMNEYPYNHLIKKDMQILLNGQKKTFVNSVKELVENPELKEKMARNCKNYIQEKYSYINDEMVKIFANTFN